GGASTTSTTGPAAVGRVEPSATGSGLDGAGSAGEDAGSTRDGTGGVSAATARRTAESGGAGAAPEVIVAASGSTGLRPAGGGWLYSTLGRPPRPSTQPARAIPSSAARTRRSIDTPG